MRVRVKGLENMPTEGGLIVAGNHVSYWDPVIIAVKLPRTINFMAKAEFFSVPVFSSLLRGLHVFPVKRGSADRQAIRHAIALLEQGKVLGIFPEGTRNQSGEDLKAQSGVAMIAAKTGAPVLPVACVGRYLSKRPGWFWPRELHIGALIEMSQYRDQKINSQQLEDISAEILDKINKLL